jgi:hypothetical protein
VDEMVWKHGCAAPHISRRRRRGSKTLAIASLKIWKVPHLEGFVQRWDLVMWCRPKAGDYLRH